MSCSPLIRSETATFFVAVFVFSASFFCFAQSSVLAEGFGVEEIQLPKMNGGQEMSGIIAVAIDGKNGKIALAKPGMWSEMPRKGKGIDGRRGFTAGTKGHVLTAAASAPRGVYVFDALAGKVMGESSNHTLDKPIKRAGGMAFYKGHIYLSDADRNLLYQVKLQRAKAIVVKTVKTSSSVNGLAANENGLYGAVGEYLVRFDSALAIKDRYNLHLEVDGLTALSDTEFIASRAAGSKLYRISIPPLR